MVDRDDAPVTGNVLANNSLRGALSRLPRNNGARISFGFGPGARSETPNRVGEAMSEIGNVQHDVVSGSRGARRCRDLLLTEKKQKSRRSKGAKRCLDRIVQYRIRLPHWHTVNSRLCDSLVMLQFAKHR